MSTVDARFRGGFGRFELDVEFTAPARGVTALFGPSGCGKTTVLRCVAGLNRMADGWLKVSGRVWQDGGTFIPPHRRPVGYVFQEASLFPHMSVRGNLVYGLKRSPAGSRTPDLDDVIDLLGLTRLLDRSPVRLSGGERQRVAVGRALMSGPEVLLMDEPLAGLDRFSKNDILPYLERLNEHLAIPILYVSHDMAEVERLADHMVVMEEGQVRTAGPLARLLSSPELPFARTLDAAAVVDGKVIGYESAYGLSTIAVDGCTLIVPGDLGGLGAHRRLRIAASDVGLCRERAPEGLSILNAVAARISAAEPLGDHQINVFLGLGRDGGGATLIARITRKSWETLDLSRDSEVIALIKSVALVESGREGDIRFASSAA